MTPYSRPLLAAKVIIVGANDRFLTVRRSKTAPRRPLTWDFPGGIIEPGESVEEAVIREAEEEVGLIITGLEPLTRIQLDGIEMQLFRSYAQHENVALSYEHDQHRWVTPAEFAEIEAPDFFKHAVRDHLI